MSDDPEPATPAPRPRTFRALLGTLLQKQRLRRGITQAQLAEYADLSLKYIGEIERGETNATLDAIERMAEALGWDPLEAWDVREPITEGVRMMLIGEGEQMRDRLRSMIVWLRAIDPVLHMRGGPGLAATPRKQVRSRAKPSQPRTTTPRR